MAPSPQAMLIIKISTSSFFTCTFGFPVLERERKENNFQVGFWLRVGGLSCGSGHSHLTQCAWLSPGYSASIQLPAINTLLVGQQGPTGTLRLAGEPLPSNSALASLQEPSLTTLHRNICYLLSLAHPGSRAPHGHLPLSTFTASYRTGLLSSSSLRG